MSEPSLQEVIRDRAKKLGWKDWGRYALWVVWAIILLVTLLLVPSSLAEDEPTAALAFGGMFVVILVLGVGIRILPPMLRPKGEKAR